MFVCQKEGQIAQYTLKQRQMCGRLQFCLFHLSIYISTVVCGDAGVTIFTAYEGGRVKITCPYEAEYKDNAKYLCRGKCPRAAGKDIAIRSKKAAEDLRFSLNDDTTARVFTITITDLRQEDGGQYWCAVERRWRLLDIYSEIMLSVKKVSHVSGVEGEELSIKCHYSHNVISNDNFLCKGDNLSFCETSGVKVSGKTNKNGRFSLTDDPSARVFTVNITDVTAEDSGIYWCGNGGHKDSRQDRHKWISAINLKISEVTSERTSHKPTTASFHTTRPASPGSSSKSPATSSSSVLFSSSSAHSLSPKTQSSLTGIILLLVLVMLMVFGFLLFMYFRRSKKNKGLQLAGVAPGSENLPSGELGQTRDVACDYEEIQLTNDPPDYSLVLSVSGECDASVYALAQMSSSDGLTYSTITFPDHSARTSLDVQTACDYATVNL